MAFDIEIVNPIPPGARDWKAHRPLGISCAATLSNTGELIHWYRRKAEGEPADRMEPEDLLELIDYLEDALSSGIRLFTWNGLGFDFDILAEESGRFEVCRSLALNHVDMMFHIFCLKGYALSLDRAAAGMGLPGKKPGMTGSMAPILWSQGQRDEVLEYVAQDVRVVLSLAHAVEIESGLRWTSRGGRPQFLPLKTGWLTAKEALDLPLPDTSWMQNPWPRSKFTSWLGKKE